MLLIKSPVILPIFVRSTLYIAAEPELPMKFPTMLLITAAWLYIALP